MYVNGNTLINCFFLRNTNENAKKPPTTQGGRAPLFTDEWEVSLYLVSG